MKIEIAIPCYNEEITIQKVIEDFRAVLPEANIVVYDNNSRDDTALIAAKAGAKVIRVNRQGKGNVVQDIFASSRADVIIMVDGDDTYEARDVMSLIDPIIKRDADMTIGTRLHSDPNEFRKMHHWGNRLLTRALNAMFRSHYRDILSGYRAFSRYFVDNIPIISSGFEVETELMIQSVQHQIRIKEIPIGFRDRPAGSLSKLSSFRDGFKIISMMLILLRDHKPLFTFSSLGLVGFIIGSTMWSIGFFYFNEVQGPNFYRSFGAVSILLSIGFFLVGLILNTINSRINELMSIIRRQPK
jgi:glycosyltransferase involved in cell wall biosynthesis